MPGVRRDPEVGDGPTLLTIQAAGQRLDPVVLGDAMSIAKATEVFVAVGSSLQVQPAASLAGIAAEHGARLIIVNAEPTPYDPVADEVVREADRHGAARAARPAPIDAPGRRRS